MRRIITISGMLLFLLLVASACQSSEEQETDNNKITDEKNADSTEEASDDTEHHADEENADNVYEYEEQEVIEGQIEEGDYDIVVETDNRENRVLFYERNGEKYYKIIYIKDQNRLKIIDIYNDHGQIYNEII